MLTPPSVAPSQYSLSTRDWAENSPMRWIKMTVTSETTRVVVPA